MELPSSSSSRPERQETPLHLTIRFTTGHEDLNLDIPSPSRTNTLQLKQQIRKSLPDDVSSNRLRLIYSGRILQDAQILSTVLKAPPPPPPSTSKKGKEPELPPSRIYINCSIGDVLTPKELEEENKESRIPSPIDTNHQPRPATTAPQPRGFDRFLDSMPAAEVADLRAQFLARLANSHTPDTMPSPTSLRRMEDAWIDEGADGAGGGGGGHGRMEVEGELDDFFWGTLMGFLWPLGMLGWGGRDGPEGGMWSERRKMAVWTGVMISLGFGIVREMS